MSQLTLPARPLSLETIREATGRFWELWLDAMFLKAEGYAYERDQRNPLGQGLLYITVVGVIVASASIIGAGMRYAAQPSLEAIKNTVLAHIQAMPFFTALPPAAQQQSAQEYNRVWDQFGALFMGYPTDAAGVALLLASVITTPLGLIIVWLIYGALVHLVGRGWNRETSFAELLAPLALASSPQLLNVLNVFPQVGVNGAVVGLWTLVCNIIAVRVAYQTTSRRAVWGALFPVLLLLVLLLIPLIILLIILPGLIVSSVRGAP